MNSTLPTGNTPTSTSPTDSKKQKESEAKHPTSLVVRETVESLAVAFILALLFKAFIAEAFVIPTGSMAPTLMGAHKDIQSEETGYLFQVGASNEYSDVGDKTGTNIIGGVCPISRRPLLFNPVEDWNHGTFSGDRILVSKLAYVWSSPRRWDVIVFKFIEKARQNYIKRCVGLPNETLRIKEGDIFIRSSKDGPFEIARKPPHVLNATMQIVDDTEFVPKTLAKANVPCSWQPQLPGDTIWTSSWASGQWSAKAQNAGAETSWLRFYHRVLDTFAWETVLETGATRVPLNPRQPRLILDFAAYNSYVTSSLDANTIQASEKDEAKANEDYKRRALSAISSLMQLGDQKHTGNDGIHWVGDLAVECDFETTVGTQSVSFLIVEGGYRHVVAINLASGEATATVEFDGKRVEAFGHEGSIADKATALTGVRAGRRHRIKFSNIDDQLTLWVDNKVIDWAPTHHLRCQSYVQEGQRGPRETEADPLDGAPIGIGVSGGSMSVSRARVFRDIYYIAHPRGLYPRLVDYPNLDQVFASSVTREAREAYALSFHGMRADEIRTRMPETLFNRHVLACNPNLWGQGPATTARSMYQYVMQDGWYFPMGDNSAASSDARSWGQHHTPERLMTGRAVVVFWPHYWNAPVTFLPNFQRMGLIR